MDIQLHQAPFDPAFIDQFVALSQTAFGTDAAESWINGLNWRLENMPDVAVFTMCEGDRLAGYKAGYATAYDRYYSWLGAVDPEFQRQGIARRLMQAQHDWLTASRFTLLETQVARTNKAMLELNLSSGFQISGEFSKKGKPYLILEKTVWAKSFAHLFNLILNSWPILT